MRRNGWELPYHPLQVVAIAVFLALSFAFYVFFVPFVGHRVLQLLGISVFSPLMVTVFGLYIWCAAINPSDPGVLKSKRNLSSCVSRTSTSFETSKVTGEKNETSTEPSSTGRPSSGQVKTNKEDNGCGHGAHKNVQTRGCHLLPGAAILSSCMRGSSTEQVQCEEDMLYCSLCEVEIFKWSKHCRVCDKCVDCFDHHCRWLNNCIGRKNYKGFIILMISGISMLILQWAVGILVIVRCFLNQRHFQEDITSRLGSSFSAVPFLSVVIVCSVLAMLATVPLGQLCLFHALLIHKGISTYDYIVAMRERDQQHGGGDNILSPYVSPASSVETAMSGGSSAGGFQQNAWCTPPRLFLDHEQAIFEHERTFQARSGEIEAARGTPAEVNLKRKVPVKISPWALAQLNTEVAVRAAAEARKNSSVLRPVARTYAEVIAETESSCESSTCEVSDEILHPSSSAREGREVMFSNTSSRNQNTSARPWSGGSGPLDKVGYGTTDELSGSQYVTGESAALTPLQVEARSAFCRSGILMSGSSTESSWASPDVRLSCESQLSMQDLPNRAIAGERPWLQRSTSDGYEASGGDSADDSDHRQQTWNKRKLHADAVESIKIEHPAAKRASTLERTHALRMKAPPNQIEGVGRSMRLGVCPRKGRQIAI